MIRFEWSATFAIMLSACATSSAPAPQEPPPAVAEPVANAEPDKPLEYYLLVEEDFEDEATDTINEDNLDNQVAELHAEIEPTSN